MKSGSYLRYVIGLLIALATVVIIWFYWLRPIDQIPAITPVGESGNVVWDKPGTNNVATTDNYQLIVGANPQFNKKQVFLPPTNSVVITNEAQLRRLIEQEKKVRQNQQSTQ